MKRLLIVGFVSLVGLSTAVAAGELTVVDVVRAHEAGVSTEILLQLVQTTPEVAAARSADEGTLRAAGVTESVIAAYLERSRIGSFSASSESVGPDDERLADLVKLVRSGLEQDLVIDHIKRIDEPFRPTVNDLIYLQQHEVPEAVVKALLASAGGAHSEAAPLTVATFEPTPPPGGETLAFQPLVRFSKVAGMLPRRTDGRLLLGAGKLQWIDEENPDLSFEFYDTVIKKVYLECEAASCFEIRIKTVHGDDYRFRDADWKVGGNAQINALWETLKSSHTKVKFLRKD